MTEELTQLIKKHGIALTGGIATGKSTVAKILAELGLVIIDADAIARHVTRPGSPALNAIVSKFGVNCMNADKSLNRSELRKIIFASDEKRRELEAITHPLIRQEFLARVAALDLARKPRDFVYEAALIYELGMGQMFREVWVTYCDTSEQQTRLMARDMVTADQSQRTIASQIDAKTKAGQADLVINTDCTLAQLKDRVTDIISKRNVKIR